MCKMKERPYNQTNTKRKIADRDRTVVLESYVGQTYRGISAELVVFGSYAREMMRTLAEVPVISMSAVNQYAKILHYTLTSQRIQTSDFIFQNEATRLLTMGKSRKIRYSIRVLSGLCRMKN